MGTRNCACRIFRGSMRSTQQFRSYSCANKIVSSPNKILVEKSLRCSRLLYSQIRWLTVSSRRKVADQQDEEELLTLLGVNKTSTPKVADESAVSSLSPSTDGGESSVLKAIIDPWRDPSNNPMNWGADGLEYIHSYGLKWSLVILGTSAAVRWLTASMYVNAEREGARHLNNMVTTIEWDRKLKDAMATANPVLMHQVQQQFHDYAKEKQLQTSYAQAGHAALRLSVIGFQLGVVSQLVARNPMGLSYEGMLWFSDLTVADPTMVLPAITAAMSWIWFLMKYEYGIQYEPTYLWSQRIISAGVAVPLLLVYSCFSSGFLLCLSTNLAISLSFITLLRLPAIRNLLKIDQIQTKTSAKEVFNASGNVGEFIARRYDAKQGYKMAKRKATGPTFHEFWSGAASKWLESRKARTNTIDKPDQKSSSN